MSLFYSESAYAQRIRFNLGGAKFPTVGAALSVSITVDCITPTVAVGTAADQSFRDDTKSAAYFGYYLTAGVRTQTQAVGTLGYLQIKKGAGETANRSYYLLGNGTSIPTAESNLTIAPAGYTSIATIPRNTTRCGPNWAANGVSGINGVTCVTTVANMDITQFVKVLWSDPPGAAITSQLSFIVVQQ